MRCKYCVWIFVIIIIAITAVLSSISLQEDYRLINDNSQTVTGPWQVETANQSLQGVEFPTSVEVEKGHKYYARTQLPEAWGTNPYLLIRSSMQDIEVKVGDDLIYNHKLSTLTSRFQLPKASLWLLVKLPENTSDRLLEIGIMSDIQAFSGTLNDVRIGQKSDLLYHIIRNQFWGIAIFGILFVIGLVVLALTSFIKSFKDDRIIHLGFLSISTAIWILSEARVLQFVSGNRFILGGISYMMVPIMGMFFILFVKDAVVMRKMSKRIMKYIALGFAGAMAIMLTNQLLGGIALIEMMRRFFFLLIGYMLIAAGTLIYEAVVWKNQQVKQLFKYIMIVLISILLEAFVFYLNRFEYTSSFFRLGVLIFLLALFVDSYVYLKGTIETQKENQLLEKLAYKDFLTGGYNRTAYERDLNSLVESGEPFRLVLLDMNHLKQINDSFGHSHGDLAIKTVFEAICESFFECGDCYRIGGDEFVVLIKNPQDSLYITCVERLEQIISNKEKEFPYSLDVAIGSDVYMKEHWAEFVRFYHQVDQLMYDNKTKKKMKSKQN